jgi:hypothetical protein
MSNKRNYKSELKALTPVWSGVARYAVCSAAAVLFAVCSAGAFAQTAASGGLKNNADDTIVHPWVAASPRGAETYFSNLKDGAVVESPFLARFGLSVRGLVPAGKTAGRAGHHHLLINQALPLDFKKPLPFTDHYIHFGKGQMEMMVDLPPGKYELRLLLADQGHIPYFVYSKPLSVTVSKRNIGVKPGEILGQPRIEIMGLDSGDIVRGPFRVQFHASGYSVGHADAKVPDTGHFRLTLDPAGRKAEVLNFSGGQTEVWLNPPPGNYSMQLEFVSNAVGHAVVSKAKPVQVQVSNMAQVQLDAL